MKRKVVIKFAGTGGLILLAIPIICILYFVFFFRVDATIYAPGFSEIKFWQIRKGMSKTEVQSIVGKPLADVEGLIEDDNKWYYAYLDRDKIHNDDRVMYTWYKVREVDFNKAGRVEKLAISKQFE